MNNLGLVHVYTGNGRGKTSISLGTSLRAIGWDKKVCMIQFIKGYSKIGEAFFAEKNPNFTFIQMEETNVLNVTLTSVENAKKSSEMAIKKAKEIIMSNEYDLVVLDEINGAIHYNLVDLEEVKKLILEKPDKLELILTGRNAHPEIIDLADYVTELKMIKHPYERKILARKGIDF